jgi:ubiquinone/menaquinone biosynthesis C-methylase UbiE
MVDYDQSEMPGSYDAGRGYAPHVLKLWLDLVAQHVQGRAPSKIVDLGCGRGRYSAALAERFGAEVDAFDPSEKMLEQARSKPHPGVRFERASAEQLPLPDDSVDLVFMSMVFHHLREPERVTRECHRVLRPGGTVCLRAGTREQALTYPYVPFFARSGALLEEMLQPRAEIVSAFVHAGLEPVHHELVASEVASNWRQAADKLAHRADSILARLSDEEFHAGLERVRRHAAGRPEAEPVIEHVDFFVFRRAR